MDMRYHCFVACFLLMLLGFSPASAQKSVSIYNISAEDYPLMTAELVAEDGFDNLITGLAVDDVTVTENGVPCPVIRLDCGTASIPRALSIGIAFDLSNSMRKMSGWSGVPFLYGQHAMRYLAGRVPFPRSEIALQGFHKYLTGGIPLTRNRTGFLDEVESLPILEENDFFLGLFEPTRGTLNVVKRGAHRKVAILVTDEHAFGGNSSDNRILDYIDTCRKYSITFYALAFRTSAQKEFTFRHLIEGTGGRLFDQLTSEEEAEEAIRAILAIEQGGKGCLLKWQSHRGCPEKRDVTAAIPLFSVTAHNDYLAPASAVPNVRFEPAGLAFGPIAPGNSRHLYATVTATNFPAVIQSLPGLVPPFYLDGISFPILLKAGESQSLPIRFVPTDSVLSFAQVRVDRDGCAPSLLDLSGGVRRKPQQLQLQVQTPNGGERIATGSTATLAWTGIAHDELVDLSYSIDAGSTWLPIVQNASGLEHQWLVPNTPSSSCLLRVYHADASSTTEFGDTAGSLNWCAISPSGDRIGVANDDFTASIRNGTTGEEISRLVGHRAGVTRIEFSPDGRFAVTASVDNTARIWDVATGAPVHVLSGHLGTVNSAEFSPDGGRIVTAGDDRTIVWSVETGAKLFQFREASPARAARFNHDGSWIVSSTNDVVIRNAFTRLELYRFGTTLSASHSEFSADGSLMLVIEGTTVNVYETSTWQLLAPIAAAGDGRDLTAHFRPGDNVIVMATQFDVEFRDPRTGGLLGRLPTNGVGAINAALNSNPGRLVTVTRSKGTIWKLSDGVEDVDLSDALWSIVRPEELEVPIADFKLNATTICRAECVMPVATSSSRAMEWKWKFEGGIPATGSGIQPGRVCYPVEGRYSVELIVANGSLADTLVRWITVGAPPAVPEIFRCGSMLVASPSESYQWFRDGVMINGATSQRIGTIGAGRYSVRATSREGCASFSSQYLVDEDDALVVSVAQSELKGMPGEMLQVPVSVRFPGAGAPAPYRLTVRLEYNATILLPIDHVPSDLRNGRRSIELVIEGESLRDTVLSIPFRVALGDSAVSTLALVEPELTMECPVALRASGGLLSLTGLCTNGGTRLIETAEASALKSITPNPVREVVTIEYSLVESGMIDIGIHDLLGRRVATVASGASTPGTFATTFDLSALPSGRYVCVYTTPTGRFSEVLTVE